LLSGCRLPPHRSAAFACTSTAPSSVRFSFSSEPPATGAAFALLCPSESCQARTRLAGAWAITLRSSVATSSPATPGSEVDVTTEDRLFLKYNVCDSQSGTGQRRRPARPEPFRAVVEAMHRELDAETTTDKRWLVHRVVGDTRTQMCNGAGRRGSSPAAASSWTAGHCRLLGRRNSLRK